MAYAAAADIATRLGRQLTTAEQDTADALIEGVAGLIAHATGKTDAELAELDPVPAVLKTVTVEAVTRVMLNPSGAQSVSEQLGSYQHAERWDTGSVGLVLTRAEQRQVREAVNGRQTSVTLASPHAGPAADDSITDSDLDFSPSALNP